MTTLSPTPDHAAPDEPSWLAGAQVRIGRYLRFLGCPHDLADDFAQDTLLAALRAFPNAEPGTGWLLTTARNRYRVHLRTADREIAAVAAGRLQKLALFGVKLAPAEFAALAALSTLRELDLTGIWWQDSHLAQLLAARTPLLRLRLRSTDISPEGLRTLTGMPTLRVLDLRSEDVLAEVLATLQQGLPDCRILGPGAPPDDPWSLDEVPGRTRRCPHGSVTMTNRAAGDVSARPALRPRPWRRAQPRTVRSGLCHRIGDAGRLRDSGNPG